MLNVVLSRYKQIQVHSELSKTYLTHLMQLIPP